jgi:hypothetical protein
VATIRRVEIDVPLTFECAGCGFTSPVVVRGRGMSSGPWASQGLSERSQADAVKNARMRSELAACPVCGVRRFDLFKKAVRMTVVYLVGFIALCAGVFYLSDSRSFMHDLGTVVALYGGMLGLMLAAVAFIFIREVRGAASKVRFPPAP